MYKENASYMKYYISQDNELVVFIIGGRSMRVFFLKEKMYLF